MTVRIVVHVQPGARRAGIVGRHGDGWKIRVTAPPVDGKANAAVTALLAEVLGVRPRAVTVVGGGTARRKIIEIAGPGSDEVEDRLAGAV